MKQKSLAVLLKHIIVVLGIFGLIIYIMVFPNLFSDLNRWAGNNHGPYWQWMIFLWISALPTYALLVFGWKICHNIGKDNSFCRANAKNLKIIALLSVATGGYLAIGTLVFFCASGFFGGSYALYMFVVCFVYFFVAVMAATLSHLVLKATLLQEQSDLTI